MLCPGVSAHRTSNAMARMWRSRGNFSSSTVSIPGIKSRPSGLVASAFTLRALWPVSPVCSIFKASSNPPSHLTSPPPLPWKVALFHPPVKVCATTARPVDGPLRRTKVLGLFLMICHSCSVTHLLPSPMQTCV